MSAAQLLALAKAKGVLIATAESCTAGLIAGAITEVAGSSSIFDRGFVTYSNDAKMQMLGVRSITLDAHGAVSEVVAQEMAKGALSRSNADLAVAVTGIAGPGGSEFKPEGRVCFGLAAEGTDTLVETVEFGAIGRSEVRAATVAHALELLKRVLGHVSTSAEDHTDLAAWLSNLVLGHRVLSVALSEHDIAITFQDRRTLTLYNQATLRPATCASFRGERVANIVAGPDTLCLRFTGGLEIMMGLRDADYRGPEAMRLRNGTDVTTWP